MKQKSTLKEIEERFDKDVERFSNLETGQQTTIDAFYNMDLIVSAIARIYPNLEHVLDIGCGAGNYDVNLLHKVEDRDIDFTLVDLSQPMLDRAKERVEKLTSGKVQTVKGDFRTVELPENRFDVVIATAVLHHLRDDKDWFNSFSRLLQLLKEGGSLWVFDMVSHDNEVMENYLYRERYGNYLTSLQDEAYRDHVFAYIEKEDSPRSIIYQLDLLRKVGFNAVEILHKNLNFASYVGFR